MSRKGTRRGHRTTRGEPCQCEPGCFERGGYATHKGLASILDGFLCALLTSDFLVAC